MKNISKVFQGLSAEGKASIMSHLDRLHREDSEKNILTLQKTLEGFTKEERDEFMATVNVGEKGKKGKKRSLKDPNHPKGAKTPYFFFSEQFIKKVKQENPEIEHKDAMKKAGEEWKKLAEDQKKPFTDQSAKDKARYEKEMESYDPSSFDPTALPRNKGRSKKPKGSPKGVRTPFMFFAKQKRKELAEAGTPKSETMAQAALIWNNLSEEQKKPYEKMQEDDKVRYEKDMKSFLQKSDENEVPTVEMATVEMDEE